MAKNDKAASKTAPAERGTSQPSKPKLASLFAGIGGFDRAFDVVGVQTVFQCESDKFCQAVLERHWPQAVRSSDIRTLEATDIPEADIWTAGFPCQDVSLARGNHGRSGLKGNHTSLFFKLADLIEAKKPPVVLLENVVGLLNSHGGQDFAIILRELAARGYAVSWRVMNARYFGAPQSRARVFICAWRGDYGRAVATLFESKIGETPGSERPSFVRETQDHRTGAIVPEIAYCVAATSGRHTGNDWSRSYVSYKDSVRRPTPTESERLQGFPTNWTVPASNFTIPAKGIDSERYKAVGNAVATPVVQWIAKRLLSQLASTKKVSSASDFAETVHQLAPDLKQDSRTWNIRKIEAELEAGTFRHRWKTGGCLFNEIILEGRAPQAPSKIITARFVDVLDQEIPDTRYFLTANAAAGIIRRADTVGRNLFPPMRKALENLLRCGIGNATHIGDLGDSLVAARLRSTRPQQRDKVEAARDGQPRRIPA